MKKIKTLKSLLVAIACGATNYVFAADDIDKLNFQNEDASSYIPSVYISGYGGTNFTGELDMLSPVYSRNDRNLFIYLQGGVGNATDQYGTTNWSASLGTGYRQIIGSRIYGAYLFGDYEQSSLGNSFIVISPGIETLGDIVDFRINGYIPLGTQEATESFFASDRGDYSHVEVYGHYYDDELLTTDEEAAYGIDSEIGVKIFSIKHMPVKVFANGWYYSSSNGNITGVGGRITFQPTAYLTLEIKDAYTAANENQDSQNVILGGIKLAFNGFSKGIANTHVDDQGLQARLNDTIERSFGSVGTGMAEPTSGKITSEGIMHKYSNVIYVESDGATNSDSSEDGTAENPYSNLDQYAVDSAYAMFSDDAIFMVAGGQSYGDSQSGTQTSLYSGQVVYGMSSDFIMPADLTEEEPSFFGSLTLNGDNVVRDINFTSAASPEQDTAILVNGNNNSLDNVDIWGSYTTGIAANSSVLNLQDVNIKATVGLNVNNAKVNLYNSTIEAEAEGDGDGIEAVGIDIENGGQVVANDCSISAVAYADISQTAVVISGTGNAYAIRADGKAEIINLKNTELNSIGYVTGGSVANKVTNLNNSGNAYGILVGNNSDINASSVNNNTVIIDGVKINSSGKNETYSDVGNNNGNGYGILLGYSSISAYGDASIYNNTVNVLDSSAINAAGYIANGSDDTASGNAYGLLVGFNSANYQLDSAPNAEINLSVHDNSIVVNSSTFTAYGIINSGFALNASGNAYGILVGGNFVNIDTTVNNYNFNSAIYNNNIVASSSTFFGSASGSDSGAIGYYSANSGNGSAMFVGFAGVDFAVSSSSTTDMTIRDNVLTIEGSLLKGYGSFKTAANGDSINSSGNSYGLFFGIEAVSFGVDASGSYDLGIYANSINVNTATVETQSNVAGDFTDSSLSAQSAGIVVGYGASVGKSAVPQNTCRISHNTLTVKDSKFEDSMLDEYGEGYGVVLGALAQDTTPYLVAGNYAYNTVQVTDSEISIRSQTTNALSGWGIMISTGGNNNSLNDDALASNTFEYYNINIEVDGQILWPDGSITPWCDHCDN